MYRVLVEYDLRDARRVEGRESARIQIRIIVSAEERRTG